MATRAKRNGRGPRFIPRCRPRRWAIHSTFTFTLDSIQEVDCKSLATPAPTAGRPCGYASKVLQNQSDLNQVEQIWVMMFPIRKNQELPGRGAEEQHDPEKG
jgi:hypothetical protein